MEVWAGSATTDVAKEILVVESDKSWLFQALLHGNDLGMNFRLLLGLLLLLSISLRGEIAFKGFMITKEKPLFVLSIDGQATSSWLSIGQVFEGFSIVAFDPKTDLLTVEKSGKRETLRLADGKVRSAAPADHKARLRTLKGLELAYEVAKGGDDQMFDMLGRYQEALRAEHIAGKPDAALQFLRMRVERLATEKAAGILVEK